VRLSMFAFFSGAYGKIIQGGRNRIEKGNHPYDIDFNYDFGWVHEQRSDAR